MTTGKLASGSSMAHLHRGGISDVVSNQNFRPELATWFHWFPLFTGLSYEAPLDTDELAEPTYGKHAKC